MVGRIICKFDSPNCLCVLIVIAFVLGLGLRNQECALLEAFVFTCA